MLSTELFVEVCTELRAMGEQVRISISKDEISFEGRSIDTWS